MSQTKLMSWEVSEFRENQRSKTWYIVMSTIAGILLIWSILSSNFLFAMIIVIVAITIAAQEKNGNKKVEFSINEDGISIGQKNWEWSAFKNFWIYYKPKEAKHLFFEWKNSIKPRLQIPIENKNPLKIRAILLKFIAEDLERENEPMSEQLARILKL
jgi:hypothetical protein